MGKIIKRPTKKIVKKRVIILWGLFFVALVASLIAERLIKIDAVAGIDGRIFFHAWFGFISCIIFVLFAKLLGFFLKRHEDYYKENIND